MEEKDRIFNPSNQTRTILKQADLIGTKTRELCQALFDEEGRPGQRKLRGIISLAKKYHALDIENACALAMERGIHSYQVVKKLVQQSTKKKSKPICAEKLIQENGLIRPPTEYAIFWNQFAADGEEKQLLLLH